MAQSNTDRLEIERQAALDTSNTGLSSDEASVRLLEYGPNELPTNDRATWWEILGRQFRSVLIAILIVAAIIAAVLGETVDAIAITAIIVLNGLLGFLQEWKAERSLDALAAMLRPKADVIRDGRRQTIEAREIVPGDLVVLEMGCTVPADLRLSTVTNLAADESPLTGESEPVSKTVRADDENVSLAEQKGRVWMGTTIVRGHGHGVVVATGLNTEFGRVAALTAHVETLDTPLTRQLNRLAQQIGIVAVTLATLVVLAGLVTGRPVTETFFLGISLAVALVPEGLPAAVTITLALGIRVMAQRRALLRRLQAAESLGAATVICTDKTGTLTENRMVAAHVVTSETTVDVSGTGYEPFGDFVDEAKVTIDPRSRHDLMELLRVASACNRAELEQDDSGQWIVRGEPTEAALLTLARKAGVEAIDGIIHEVPFSSDRKRMSVVVDDDAPVVLVKGAPDVLMARSTHVLRGEAVHPFDTEKREAWADQITAMAKEGIRTLGFAMRAVDTHELEDIRRGQPNDEAIEADLTFLGAVGLLDPPPP